MNNLNQIKMHVKRQDKDKGTGRWGDGEIRESGDQETWRQGEKGSFENRKMGKSV